MPRASRLAPLPYIPLPPDTVSNAPVVKLEAALAKYRAAPTISFG